MPRKAKTHHLKSQPQYFRAVMEGRKTFEIRINDRDFREGDRVVLREYLGEGGYTDRTIERIIGAVSSYAQMEGFCVFSLLPIEIPPDALEHLKAMATRGGQSGGISEETRQKLREYGYAEGTYCCRCALCREKFTGDKHCVVCKACAGERAISALLASGEVVVREPELESADVPKITFVDALIEAKKIVKGKELFRKFIDGTPFSNDIAVWMAEFLVKGGKP